MKAAILWAILPKQLKKNVSHYLNYEEIQKLNEIVKNYKKLSIQDKKKIDNELYKFFFIYKIPIEIVFIVLLFVFILSFFIYIFQYQPQPLFLFQLYWPFFLGLLSFGFYKVFKPIEFNYYFSFPKSFFIYFYGLIVSYLLLYILFLINEFEYISHNLFFLIEKIIVSFGIVLAPFSEEVIFRHLIPNLIGRISIRNILGHIFSNILFSILHLPLNWEQGMLYFVSGMFLSLLKIYSDNLLICIFSHSLANLIYFIFF